ncbi:MAG: outer membrane lipoprotein carrier protein LolA [Bacteroidales bacterium]|jgi:outer membrane lipoprotein carrier protein|nr:outer membrane lipoprotein carrier protein LolA [Bacteroidales bacterium]
MHKLTTVILIFSLFLLGNTLQAQEESFKKISPVEEVKKKLEQSTQKITTIKSQFIQEKHLSFLTENIISEGEFYFKNPVFLRWEYSAPFEYIIVFTDKNIFIRDEDNISSFDTESNKMFSEINNIMTGTIQGNLFKDSERFTVEYYENKKQYLLKLTPKMQEMKNMLKSIHIWIDKSDLSVAKIKMNESSGDYTSITFINRELNTKIDHGIFDINR